MPEHLKWTVSLKAIDPRALRGRDPGQVAEDARRLFIETGQEARGIHLVGKWRHPGRQNDWKTTDDEGQSLEEFYTRIVRPWVESHRKRR